MAPSRPHSSNVDWRLTRSRDRALDDLVAACVAPNSGVLDLGCGEGQLLMRLKAEKDVRERGVERDPAAVAACIAKGLSVIQGDLEDGLEELGEGAFDLVILNQVIPVVEDPVGLIRESLRIGRRAVVTFPNFAYWDDRWQLAVRGHLPVTPSLPYQWHDTPNIRLVTIRDFDELCRREGWKVVERKAARLDTDGVVKEVGFLPNLRASVAMFLLEKIRNDATHKRQKS